MRAAIELWKASISLRDVRDQQQMSWRGLKNILAYAKKNTEDHIPKNKNAGRSNKASLCDPQADQEEGPSGPPQSLPNT
jgi:hypothetical protein